MKTIKKENKREMKAAHETLGSGKWKIMSTLNQLRLQKTVHCKQLIHIYMI